MKVVIVRHGQAESHAPSDAERNLSSYGREQSWRLGQLLKLQNFNPELLWVSPYTRTQQTADELQQSLAIGEGEAVPRETVDFLVPDAQPGQVVEKIANCSVENLLIVSHQPLVSTLVGLLASSDRCAVPPMLPSTVAMLEAESPYAGCFELKWLSHAPNFEVIY